MIDFRYHLISLIAVFLALGLGILLGSVVIDQALVTHLEGEVERIRSSNAENREEISTLNDRLDGLEVFVSQSQRQLTAGELIGNDVVLITYERSDEGSRDALVEAIDIAGGEVTSEITLTDAVALRDAGADDRVGEVLRPPPSDVSPSVLRSQLMTELGERLARAATEDRRGTAGRARRFLDRMEAQGLVGVDDAEPVTPLGEGTLFIVLGGSVEDAPYDVSRTNMRLVSALAEGGAMLLAAEPTNSVWSVVAPIRSDGTLASQVATVDNIDRPAGRIAAVLGLDLASEGIVDHYGFGEDADPFPERSPED